MATIPTSYLQDWFYKTITTSWADIFLKTAMQSHTIFIFKKPKKLIKVSMQHEHNIFNELHYYDK